MTPSLIVQHAVAALGIAASAASIYQLYMARAQTRRLDKMHKSLSTRYVGAFPGFMPEIVELMKSARDGIVICSDFPAYGRFSSPQLYLQYLQCMEELSKKQHGLELLCFDAASRNSHSRDQFDLAELTRWKRDPIQREKLTGLQRDFPVVASVDEITAEAFIRMLELADQEALDRIRARGKIHQLGALPLFFWIADRRRAVFSFPTEKAGESGFITSDRDLISAFIRMKDIYLQNAAGSVGPPT